MKKSFLTYLLPLLFAVLISVPVILPFLHSGYFPTHDGEWAVVRLSEMFRELRDFQFPPRYSTYLNFGYGYPLFNFAYPFPYYFSILLYLLKFGFAGSIKLTFVLSVLFSAIFMFLLSKKLWKSNLAGIVSAILYIYLPYRMVDLFVRGSIGESLSFAFFPLIILFVLRIIDNPSSKRDVVLASIFYAGLIITHNIMAVLFSLVLFIFLFIHVLFGERRAIRSLSIFILFGFFLAAFFWLPALFEKQYILLSKIPIADRNLYFVNLKQLLAPTWAYGIPTDKANGFTYQLGISHVVTLVFSFVFLIVSFLRKRINFNNQINKYVFILTVTTFVLIFSLFSFSSILWKLPVLSEINYPWTMLLPIGFLISLLAGFITTFKSKMKYLNVFLVVISVYFVLPYAKPQAYVDRGDAFYMTNMATTTSSSEYTPLWVKKMPEFNPIKQVEILEGKADIRNISYNSNKISFNIEALGNTKVQVNTIYYPGWKAYVDGKETDINYDNDRGAMDVAIPKGKHNIQLTFTETYIRLFADVLSVLSLLGLLCFLLI